MMEFENMEKVPMLWFWMLLSILAMFLTAPLGLFGIALLIFCCFQFWIWWKIYEKRFGE